MAPIYTLTTTHADGVGEIIHASDINANAAAINEISARPQKVALWKSQRWYSLQQAYGASYAGSMTVTANEMYASPLFVPVATAIDQVGVRVSTGVAATTVRLMAYAEGSDGHPGALLFDWGTVSGTATGDMAISISATLPAGIIWLACVSNGAAILGIFGTGSVSLTGSGFQAGGDGSPHRANGGTTAPNPFGTSSISYVTDNFLRLAVRAL